jgi:membrane associated rhomboid family serine protease
MGVHACSHLSGGYTLQSVADSDRSLAITPLFTDDVTVADSDRSLCSLMTALLLTVIAPSVHLWRLRYMNMSSLLWKGRELEGRLGSEQFARLLVILATLSGLLVAILGWALLCVGWTGPFKPIFGF